MHGRDLLQRYDQEERDMVGFDRISFDPTLMGGRACIRGMRVTVSLVVNLVANGMTTAEILSAYPYLASEDVRQALQYVAWLAEEAIYPARTA
jgi:uncharacterized protein (DUF433 family)